MRAFKVIALGIVFTAVGFLALIVISSMSGRASLQTGHATGLSAVRAGLMEGFYSPITLLVVVVAFVAATWVTRKPSKRSSTS